MRLEQLEYFIEVANTRSISIAAESLFVSQPAVSRAIKSLEEELGVELFYRTVDGVRLTKTGEMLLPQMKQILADVKDLRTMAAGSAKTCQDTDLKGDFHIYTLPVLSDSLLLPALESLRDQYPGIEPYVHFLKWEDSMSFTIAEDTDLLILADVDNILDQDIIDSGWHMEQLFIGNSFTVVSKDNPLAEKKILTRKEALSQKLIMHLNGFNQDLFYQKISGITPNVIMRSNNARAIIQTLKTRRDVAFLTNNLLMQIDYQNDPELVILPIKNSRLQYFCLFEDDHPMRCFIDDLIAALKTARETL